MYKCIVSVLSIKQCIDIAVLLTAKCAIIFVSLNVEKSSVLKLLMDIKIKNHH